MKKRILLIGGCGYIGSALYRHLTESDRAGDRYEVEVVDLLWFGNPAGVPVARKDYAELEPAYLIDFDVVVLLAGHSSVRMAENGKEAAFHNNVIKFAGLLEKLHACRHLGLERQKLIYASSGSVYHGQPDGREDVAHFAPRTAYDAQKWAVDVLALASGLEAYGLRLGTVCGGSPNLRTDLLVNTMYHTAKQTGEVVVSNPQAYRAVLGMSDLLWAVGKVIDEPRDLRGVYNVASFTWTIGRVARQVAALMRVPLREVPGEPTYDFGMDTTKFCFFQSRFRDTCASILGDLARDYDAAAKGVRA